MPVSNVSDRNYLDLLGSAGADKKPVENLEKKYGIKYQTEDAGNLGYEDFLKLMITQLTNQDFTNPTNDSEYMAQMTQFGTLQAMQEMTKYSQNNYAMSMIGKTVTASKYSNGNMVKETGVVEQITRKNDEYSLLINGKEFTLKQISSVGTGDVLTEDSEEENPEMQNFNTGNMINTGETGTVNSPVTQGSVVDIHQYDPEAAMG